jgi:hypothetical protein
MEEEHKGIVAGQEAQTEQTNPSKNQLARDAKKMKKKVA